MGTVTITKMQVLVSEAASLLSQSTFVIYRAIHTGKLKAHKEGKAYKILVSDLEAYAEVLGKSIH